MNTRVQLTNVLCIQNGTSQYDWPAGPPATPNKPETTAATTAIAVSAAAKLKNVGFAACCAAQSPRVRPAAKTSQSPGVRPAAKTSAQAGPKLPEGWTMGKTDDGLSTDCLFINTGARCLAKPIELCAPDSVMVSGSDERKILPHATSTASLRATAGAASRLV